MVWSKLSKIFVSVDLMQTFMEHRKIHFSSLTGHSQGEHRKAPADLKAMDLSHHGARFQLCNETKTSGSTYQEVSRPLLHLPERLLTDGQNCHVT